MHWTAAGGLLRDERRAGVLVTVTGVRGHAPRDAGAKMVVAADRAWGSVGGGNLEETALARARALLADPAAPPEQLTVGLTDHARTDHGRQCCGGEVMLLLEPLPVVPAVAVFGVGHVGLELARILSRHDLDLHLVDSRRDQLAETRLAVLDDGDARVLTDHAEDFALCDEALRCAGLGSIGLIGSAAKWSRFRTGLAVEGHPEATIDRIRCPIGLSGPTPTSKVPAAIAVSVAAELLTLVADRAGAER